MQLVFVTSQNLTQRAVQDSGKREGKLPRYPFASSIWVAKKISRLTLTGMVTNQGGCLPLA